MSVRVRGRVGVQVSVRVRGKKQEERTKLNLKDLVRNLNPCIDSLEPIDLGIRLRVSFG